jgi:hypothetical protein
VICTALNGWKFKDCNDELIVTLALTYNVESSTFKDYYVD